MSWYYWLIYLGFAFGIVFLGNWEENRRVERKVQEALKKRESKPVVNKVDSVKPKTQFFKNYCKYFRYSMGCGDDFDMELTKFCAKSSECSDEIHKNVDCKNCPDYEAFSNSTIYQITDEKYQDIFYHYFGLTRQSPYFSKIDLYAANPQYTNDLIEIKNFCQKYNCGKVNINELMKLGHKYVICITPESADESNDKHILFVVDCERLRHFYEEVIKKIIEI